MAPEGVADTMDRAASELERPRYTVSRNPAGSWNVNDTALLRVKSIWYTEAKALLVAAELNAEGS